MINRYENTTTNNIIVAEQSFIDSLPDTYENLGEANPAIPEVPKTLQELKNEKLQALAQKASDQYTEQLKYYSLNEQATFATQEAEYLAWEADGTSLTPTVDRISTARGVDRIVLLAKIGANIEQRDIATGQQQAVEDLIKACTTITQLEGIEI